jgi:TetR/AcrR family transcriptional regulator, transcriptional repressor for nem operon
LDQYRDTIVTQALAVMTAPDAGIDGIANYFEFLIQQAQQRNCLSRGCLMTNTMVTMADRDRAIAAKVDDHFERITAGMRQALRSPASSGNVAVINAQALYLATFAQGLWIRARAGANAATLRAAIAPLKST